MTDTAERKPVAWDAITPVFGARLKGPKLPPRPSDGAVAMAQKSLDGMTDPESGEVMHVITHRFPSVEMADLAADELKRAGSYTNPVSTVTVVRGPDFKDEDPKFDDQRWVRWRAGGKRGRK